MAAIATTAAAQTAATGFAPKRILARVLAAVLAAAARAATRRDYERMMASDEILSDVGVGRDAVRQALENGRS